MKIVSISTADRKWLLSNYGGMLQHFALREVLKGMGFAPYRIEAGRPRGEIKAFLRPLKDLCNNLLALARPSRKKRPLRLFYYWSHRIRFICDYRKLVGSLFENQRRQRFAAIVGGGQAWSIYCQNRPDLYWEDDDSPMRRVAYSVSSAWIALKDNDAWKQRIRAACIKADAVSLRENAGVSLCASLLPGKSFYTTLDPVFLMTAQEYGRFLPERKIFTQETVFFYFVEVHDAEYIDEGKLRKFAKEMGCECRMTGIQGAEFYVPCGMEINPGPVDFLRCCRDAKCIVTNSFHGAVLALVFGKNFLFVGQRDPNGTGSRNQRQIELLQEFDLADRAIAIEAGVHEMVAAMERKMDWGKIFEMLEKRRTDSIGWLRSALD